MTEFKIGNRWVGKNHPPLIIAELGINHSGSLQTALKLANSAIENGAEVIKNQTHFIEDEMSHEAKFIKPGNANESIYDVILKNHLDPLSEIELKKFVESKNTIYLSTPFSKKAVDFLNDLNIPAFKIGSGECNNYPLVEYIASKNKPVILSTGMNSIETIKPAVEILRKYKIKYALLHCTNLYPTSNNQIRLNSILELKNFFPDAVIGYSDHTTSNAAALGAVALGASIIERHYTDTRSRKGPDIVCSMNKYELKELLHYTNAIWLSLKGNKIPLKEESVTSNFAFSSVVAIENIKKGDTLSEKNIWVMRPSGGYPASMFYKLLGKKIKVDVKKGFQLPKDSVEK